MKEREKQRLIQCITCARDPETCGCTEANEDENGFCTEWEINEGQTIHDA